MDSIPNFEANLPKIQPPQPAPVKPAETWYATENIVIGDVNVNNVATEFMYQSLGNSLKYMANFVQDWKALDQKRKMFKLKETQQRLEMKLKKREIDLEGTIRMRGWLPEDAVNTRINNQSRDLWSLPYSSFHAPFMGDNQ
tara:strand:- start:28 stop:450 length:423 start_codon:yes stop_codon:yes gene_type:complete